MFLPNKVLLTFKFCLEPNLKKNDWFDKQFPVNWGIYSSIMHKW